MRNEESCICIPSDEGCKNSEPTQAKKARKERAFKNILFFIFFTVFFVKASYKLWDQLSFL